MEQLKSSVRPYKVNQHFKQSLKGGPEYYRMRLDSEHKRAGSSNVDAYFDISNVFPNNRTDLLSGEWEMFLEQFSGHFQDVLKDDADEEVVLAETTATQRGCQHLQVVLPELLQSSNDWIVGSTGCRQSHVLGYVVIPVEFDARGTEIDGAGDFINVVNPFKIMPAFHQETISRDSVGRKIDLRAFDGIIHVQLLTGEGATIPIGTDPGEIASTERWQATLLFVHR